MWDGSSINNRPARTIYVATDDPITVRDEISKLPRGKDDTTIVGGKLWYCLCGAVQYFPCHVLNYRWFVVDDHLGCERVKLVISPMTQSSYHIGSGGFKVDCVERKWSCHRGTMYRLLVMHPLTNITAPRFTMQFRKQATNATSTQLPI